MLFKSRYKETFLNKINKYMWPKSGWKRAGRYLSLRVKRLPGSPHSIALGFSLGTAIAMTPLYGAHFLLGIFFAWLLGGSIAASVIGNLIGNPWTYPFVCLISFKMGTFFVSSNTSDLVTIASISNELSSLGQIIISIIIDGNFYKAWGSLTNLDLIPLMIIGSIPLSLIVGLISYCLSRKLISDYQNRRKIQIANKSRKNGD